MSAHWIAVASAEHVPLGREQGFMQVCLGKAAPIRPLLGSLVLAGDGCNWGYKFRFGRSEIGEVDADLIAREMLGRVAVK